MEILAEKEQKKNHTTKGERREKRLVYEQIQGGFKKSLNFEEGTGETIARALIPFSQKGNGLGC